MPEYFLILLALFLAGFILHRLFAVKLFRTTKHMIFTYSVSLVVGTIWDQFAIWRGHWSFGEQFLLDIKLGFMPIEEFFFIVVLTYFGLVIYKIFEKLN